MICLGVKEDLLVASQKTCLWRHRMSCLGVKEDLRVVSKKTCLWRHRRPTCGVTARPAWLATECPACGVTEDLLVASKKAITGYATEVALDITEQSVH